MGAGISGATVINGVDGFGRCGESSFVNDISVKYPLIIQVVDEQSKLGPLLPQREIEGLAAKQYY
jgi:PII-like signaling protein